MRRAPTVVALAAWACVALAASCKSNDSAQPDAASSSSASASDSSAAPAVASSSAAAWIPMELQRWTFTSKIKAKEPADTLEAAEPGKRVWVHFALRNRSGVTRKLNVAFSVNGEKRTTLTLKVEPSWSFRTFGYNTLRKADTEGEVTMEATDEQGIVVATGKLPIKAKAVKKAK